MENIVLVIHLLLALSLIGIVLIQRSEGGGLGIGGGGNGGTSGRSGGTALGKVTWVLAGGFIMTSITLTVIAAQNAGAGSVLDRVGGKAPAPIEAPASSLGEGDALLPPSSGDETLTPPAAE
ncbi:preprotein translocase subunit SecG [Falsihalocynthiibacter arcticus]|uniref:Protein-export membrane protein SecG n=1 Tax=Falsihalocynthiibacter arcticus TaxID=1579316 RepID=A0A126UW38_9RHOB|nr:preprotein translocase subunit SecG [Falsihalocynthiibacter arcticus]AML49945.1 preprotein translocase subunit SecG [Falsihalocynthiibacter arcticus]